jgi:hypothetical protein
MTIENEAFIDLENALHVKFNRLWTPLWRDLQKELIRLANEGKWREARQLANNIDLKPLVDKLRPVARTFSEAALFLGASRIDDPKNASFFGNPEERLIQNGVDQWAVVLERNATISLQTQATTLLSSMETQAIASASTRILKADPGLAKVGKSGTQFSRATASLMISRMSTAGFMLEASARGIQSYRVNEVMDAATCPICAEMHNKTFPVSDGLALSSAVMGATDPESLKSIAPFPSQSKTNIKAVKGMNQQQLTGAGMNLPPYHPYCRGITSLEVENRGTASAGFGAAPGVGLVGVEGLTQDQIAARMFGTFDDLDDEALAIALGGAGAPLVFGDNE